MGGTIRVEREQAVATIVIDNPGKRNSFTTEMLDLLATQAKTLASDDEVRAIILRGAGDLAFSAGADIGGFEAENTQAFIHNFQTMEESLDRAVASLLALPQPLIAALPGACMGGAVQLALCADFRMASERLRFAIPAASIGIVYPLDAIQRLLRLCGPGTTSLLLLAGATFSAEEASRAGIIEMIVPHATFNTEVAAIALKLSRQPKTTIRAYKQIIDGMARGTDCGLLHEVQKSVNRSEETARMVAAAVSRRKGERHHQPSSESR
jgi:enoyl-CoA hydratase/carnithine racemase